MVSVCKWLVLLAPLAQLGCSAAVVHGGFVLHEVPPDPTYAVVLPQTAWATAPLPGAQTVQPAAGQTSSFFGRLLGFRGGMAALEVGEPQGQHCAAALDHLDGVRLVLWVPRDRLAPVLTRPQRLRHPDGSGYDLAPGLPVGQAVADGPAPGQRYRPLATERFLSAAALADSAVGLAYQPAPLPKAETASQEQWIDGPTLPLGDGQLLRQPHHHDELWSDQVRPDPQDPSMVLVGLQDRCARFTVRLPASGLGQVVGGFLLGSLGAGASQVRGGAVLTWADGSLAGRTVRDTWVGRVLPARGERMCFAVALFAYGSRKGAKALRPVEAGEVEVCAEVGDRLAR